MTGDVRENEAGDRLGGTCTRLNFIKAADRRG